MASGEFKTTEDLRSRSITVAQALQNGAGRLDRLGIQTARLDADVLLAKVLGWTRERLFLNYERPLKIHEEDLFLRLLHRRSRGEPIAYITGHREFWSLDFSVTQDVLVPRPETELLVEATLGLIEKVAAHRKSIDQNAKLQILDLGTGCGAIGVSLGKERDDLEIWATDLSRKALEIARGNAERHGLIDRIHFVHGDLFEPLKSRQRFFHGVVSNPPYVRLKEIEHLPADVRDWEPDLALDGGPDGLDFHRRIIQQGHRYLKDGGFIVLEIAPDMGEEVCRLFESAGCYSESSIHQDHAGRNRLVAARKLLHPRRLS